MAGVEIDTSHLTRDTRRLVDGITRASTDAARRAALDTAQVIASRVPVRTGALRASVTTEAVPTGYAVVYGAGLRYAKPVEARFHPVNSSTADGERRYRDAATAAVVAEVAKL